MPESLQDNYPTVKVETEGIELLGVPFGSDDFCKKMVEEKILKCVELGSKFKRLNDLHYEYRMNNALLTFSNLTYILRTVPPRLINLEPWKNHIITTLQRLMMCREQEITEDVLTQAGFAVKDGGLGLRTDPYLPYAAYLASTISAESTVVNILRTPRWQCEEKEILIEKLTEVCGEEEITKVLSSRKKLQRRLCQQLDMTHKTRMINENNLARDAARISCFVDAGHGSEFLGAIPNENYRTKIPDREFAVILRYRLGVRIYHPGETCNNCHDELDEFGDHALHCKKGGFLSARHDAVRDFGIYMSQSAGLKPRKEPNYLRGMDSGEKPGDIVIHNTADTADAYDVTIISPLQRNHVRKSIDNPRHVLRIAERNKIRSYKPDENGEIAANVKLTPLAITSLGALSNDTDKFFLFIAQHLNFKWGYNAHTSKRFMMQQLSCLIQRFNAQAFLGRFNMKLGKKVAIIHDILTTVT